MAISEPGFGVYVHWPFCMAKCPYCDFNSHVRHIAPDQKRIARAFVTEIETTAARTGKRTVNSIFFGGGTPSLMEPATVETILNAISKNWSVSENAEITMEANPTSVEAERFSAYRSAGVNRISLGVQALNDEDLRFLGRMHSVDQALKAVDLARNTFPRLSFDLIYARPNQTPDAWGKELERAIGFAADHLSLYQLTIEPDTPFFKLFHAGKFPMPDEDTSVALYQTTHAICDAHGMPAYEISNHAREGAECRHNLIYWRYGEYAGIGPGAHGRLVSGNVRFATEMEKMPETWLDRVEKFGHGWILDDPLTLEQQGDEYLLMGLRLKEGIDLERFESLSQRSLDPGRLKDLVGHGMIEVVEGKRVRATREGFFVLDAVVADLAS